MSATKRSHVAKEASLCFNCLKPGHGVHQCKSEHKCKKCHKSHNSLLHRDPTPPPTGDSQSPVVVNHSACGDEEVV